MKRIKLTQNKFALVDDEDYEMVSGFKWHYDNGYAKHHHYIKTVKGRPITKKVFIHSLIMNTPKGMDTDHIDGNRLDNRRNNLRICTRRENGQNRKEHRKGKLLGVNTVKRKSLNNSYTYHHAGIQINGRRVHLGTFATPELAHRAYLDKALFLAQEKIKKLI